MTYALTLNGRLIRTMLTEQDVTTSVHSYLNGGWTVTHTRDGFYAVRGTDKVTCYPYGGVI